MKIAAGRRLPRLPTWVGPTLFGVAVIFVWELWLRWSDIPQIILPRPSDIAQAAAAGLQSGLLLRHFWITATEALLGLLIGFALAAALGIPISLSRTIERYLYPFILALQTTPKIAIAPLLIIWMGIGIESKVFIASILVMFPVLINFVVGGRSIERQHLELLDVYRGDWIDQVRYVRVPTALPFIFAGLKTGSVLGLLGAVTGEFVGATGGLGYLLTQQMNRLDTAGVFSVLVLLMIMGLTIYLVMDWLERKAIFWRQTDATRTLRQL